MLDKVISFDDDQHGVLTAPPPFVVIGSAGGGFTSGDFVDVLEAFPDSLVPARRKRRAYISSVLAKNEVNRDGPYNRRLFRRVKYGHYGLDPHLAVSVEGAWRGIYELLSLEALGHR